MVAGAEQGVFIRHQVRTQTLVKNAIIQVDATPFKQWYQQHYGVEPGQKKRGGAAAEAEVRLLHVCCAEALWLSLVACAAALGAWLLMHGCFTCLCAGH